MNRGEVWTLAGSGPYTNKPRPVVIVQDNLMDATDSITICPITGDPEDLPLFRITVAPTPGNGLTRESRVMADKVTTVRRSSMGRLLGALTDEEMEWLGRALILFLGLATPRVATPQS